VSAFLWVVHWCSPKPCSHEPPGLESRLLESRPKTEARLDLEVSAGRASPSSRGLWGGAAPFLTGGWEPKPQAHPRLSV
jgi:hypothetical protein